MHIPKSNTLTWISLIFFFGQILPSTAQQTHFAEAHSFAFSGSGASIPGVWLSGQNPAYLARFGAPLLGISYHNRYFIPDIGTSSMVYVLPRYGVWGFGLNYFGTGLYNETGISVSYGRSLYSWLHAGVTMNGSHTFSEPFTRHNFYISGDIGLSFKTSDEIQFNLYLVNPAGTNNESFIRQTLSRNISAGVVYNPADRMSLASQVNITDYSAVHYSFGAACGFFKPFTFLAGVSIGSVTGYSYGLDLEFRKFHFLIAFENHSYLGESTALSFIYLPDDKKKNR